MPQTVVRRSGARTWSTSVPSTSTTRPTCIPPTPSCVSTARSLRWRLAAIAGPVHRGRRGMTAWPSHDPKPARDARRWWEKGRRRRPRPTRSGWWSCGIWCPRPECAPHRLPATGVPDVSTTSTSRPNQGRWGRASLAGYLRVHAYTQNRISPVSSFCQSKTGVALTLVVNGDPTLQHVQRRSSRRSASRRRILPPRPCRTPAQAE
jgi:hypothetical protein